MESFDAQNVQELVSRITPQWLAGFFDGEGSVSAKDYNGHFSLQVSLTQNKLFIMTVIGLRFGACPYISDRKSRKPCYKIQLFGRAAIPLLEFIKDHVIVKREQVLLGLRIARVMPGPGERISFQDKQKRLELGSQITKLNDAAPRSKSVEEKIQ